MVETLKKPDHMLHWVDILQGSTPKWETVFHGYQAAVDWPVAAYYRDLISVYPEAKVILTVRDPESWHRSIMTTFYQARRGFVMRLTRALPVLHRFLDAMEAALWQNMFHNRLEDKAHAIEVFKRHVEEVQYVVPAERLLVFEAKDGWGPLCSFLNVPVPVNKPYPHKHKGTFVRNFLKYTNLTKYH
jgi:hypothetical protein